MECYPEAETAFREVIRLDPAYAAGWSGLGLVMEIMDRYPEAEAAYWEAIRIDPTDELTRKNLAEVLKAQ